MIPISTIDFLYLVRNDFPIQPWNNSNNFVHTFVITQCFHVIHDKENAKYIFSLILVIVREKHFLPRRKFKFLITSTWLLVEIFIYKSLKHRLRRPSRFVRLYTIVKYSNDSFFFVFMDEKNRVSGKTGLKKWLVYFYVSFGYYKIQRCWLLNELMF